MAAPNKKEQRGTQGSGPDAAPAWVITQENLTPKQTSALLQTPESTLAVWRSTNRVNLPYFKLGGHVRYRRADTQAFIEANMRGGVTA